MKSRCEFCGRIREVKGTSFVGNYCRECHRLVINESKEAIKEIDKRSQPTKKKPIIKNEFERARGHLLKRPGI